MPTNEYQTPLPIPENPQWIAVAAYYKALARGFAPNYDLDDWLAAKKNYENFYLAQRKNGLVCLGHDPSQPTATL